MVAKAAVSHGEGKLLALTNVFHALIHEAWLATSCAMTCG